MKPLFSMRLLTGCSAALLTLCATAEPSPSLYERLGGAPVMSGVVSRTLERTASSPLTQRSFKGIKLATLNQSLLMQICSISGGGCKYEGDTMVNAHKDAKIQPHEFDAMVAMLREELDRAGVAVGAKNDLLRLLAPMKRDIVPSN